MSIFDLEFKPVDMTRSRRVAQTGEVFNGIKVHVVKTGSNRPAATCITISRKMVMATGYSAGMRIMVGMSNSDKGLVVKLWRDDLRGFKLCSSNDKRLKAGYETDLYIKSHKFADIPEGVYQGDDVGFEDGDIYFLTGDGK